MAVIQKMQITKRESNEIILVETHGGVLRDNNEKIF